MKVFIEIILLNNAHSMVKRFDKLALNAIDEQLNIKRSNLMIRYVSCHKINSIRGIL